MEKEYLALKCKTEVAPYSVAKTKLEAIDEEVKQMNRLRTEINNEYANFTSYSKGKSKISSGTEEWKKLKGTKKKMKSLVGELQKKGNKTVKSATEFNQYVTENIVPIVQYCDINAFNVKFSQIQTNLEKNEQELIVQLKKYETQFSRINLRFSGSSPDKCEGLKNDLLKLNEEKKKLIEIRLQIEESATSFKNQTNGKTKVYSCSNEWESVNKVTSDFKNYENDLGTLQATVQGLVQHMQSILDTLK
jgi:archaellum component FlaC